VRSSVNKSEHVQYNLHTMQDRSRGYFKSREKTVKSSRLCRGVLQIANHKKPQKRRELACPSGDMNRVPPDALPHDVACSVHYTVTGKEE